MDPLTMERIESGIVVLRLQDGLNKNHLTGALCAAWMDALDQLAANRSVHVLLIAGLPDVFCAGASEVELAQITSGQFDIRDLELSERILRFPLPIVAAMEGHAVGGGLMAALCCDLVIAANEMRYGVNFTELGFTPGMGATRLLPMLAGHALAAEMLLSGRFYRGDELARRGLFNAGLPSAEVFAHALDLARQMASKPRYVLEMTKVALAESRRTELLQAISREHLMHRICFSAAGPSSAEDAFSKGSAT